MNKTFGVQADTSTIQRTVLSLIGESGGLITSQTPNGITATFTTKPNILITIILFLFAFIPGLLYYWFAGRTYQIVVQFHEDQPGSTTLNVTANGGRAKKVANRLIAMLGTNAAAGPAAQQPSAPLPAQAPPQYAPPVAPPAVGGGKPVYPAPTGQATPLPAPIPAATQAPAGARACVACGEGLAPGDIFCTRCGARVPEATVAVAPAVVMPTAFAPTASPSPVAPTQVITAMPSPMSPPMPVASMPAAAPAPPLEPAPPFVAGLDRDSGPAVASPEREAYPLAQMQEGQPSVVFADQYDFPADDGGATIAVEESEPPPVEAVDRDAFPPSEGECLTILEEPEPTPLLQAELDPGVSEAVAIALFDESEQFTVGRDSAATDYAIADPRASRKHFAITVRSGQAWLEDLGSSNGTYVNGSKVDAPTALADGDSIGVGHTELRFHLTR